MSFFDKIYDIAHTDLFKYVFHSGKDKVFVANVSKITTVDENVLDSKWTLTSHTLRLVAGSQQIRVCEASVTNEKCRGKNEASLGISRREVNSLNSPGQSLDRKRF